ncbi:MAG: hypothetical protein RLZZ28_1745 [Bacteroidota bacterium]
MTASPLLQVNNLSVHLSGKPVLKGISFVVERGQMLAIVGNSGSGKTTLMKALTGNCFASGHIEFADINGQKPYLVSISQQHDFKNLSNISSFYYQQRFNSADSEDAVTAGDALHEINPDNEQIDDTLQKLGIQYIKKTRLIQLSNGEHKKFQIARALLQNAQWLLLDNPYIGLDKAARADLNMLLDDLGSKGIHILLITSAAEIPAGITHIALLKEGVLGELMEKNQFQAISQKTTAKISVWPSFKKIPAAFSYPDFLIAVKMVNAGIVYNGRKILEGINWEVKKGECWNVSGHNGSGKSTLLSLVNGDNPQAFANEIYLFDRKKGSGESIWDIKQKIGYVSPELHHYFETGSTVFEVVASGLFDTIGLFRRLSDSFSELVNRWMELLGVKNLEKRFFSQLSNGEQRLVLLARALVKNPPLLILDEPCQGLDMQTTELFIALINHICTDLNKTLIYVSHYQEEIPACVTHTLQLNKGSIAA